MQINRHYLDLKDSYLFATIAKKVNAYQSANPQAKLIRLGIGDVTLPSARRSSRPSTARWTKWPSRKPSAAMPPTNKATPS